MTVEIGAWRAYYPPVAKNKRDSAHLQRDLALALGRCQALVGMDLRPPTPNLVTYKWVLQDFAAAVQPLNWEIRTGVVMDAIKHLVELDYPQSVIGDVLNATGVSPQDIEGYRLGEALPSSHAKVPGRRL